MEKHIERKAEGKILEQWRAKDCFLAIWVENRLFVKNWQLNAANKAQLGNFFTPKL